MGRSLTPAGPSALAPSTAGTGRSPGRVVLRPHRPQPPSTTWGRRPARLYAALRATGRGGLGTAGRARLGPALRAGQLADRRAHGLRRGRRVRRLPGAAGGAV